MEKTIPPSSTHLSRQKLNTYRELCNRLTEVEQQSKTDGHMKKVRRGQAAECFRHLGEIKRRETEALKTLENYLKTDAQQNPAHKHTKDLQHIATALAQNKKHGGWAA